MKAKQEESKLMRKMEKKNGQNASMCVKKRKRERERERAREGERNEARTKRETFTYTNRQT